MGSACLRSVALALLMVLALGASACRHADGPPVKLYILDGGTTLVNDPSFFGDPNLPTQPFSLAVCSFLIVHPKGTVLWDAGHALGQAKPDGPDSAALRAVSGPPLRDQLREIGFAPHDVDYLAFSHMHADHTGQANEFAESVVLVQRDEWSVAFGPDASTTFGMAPATYVALKDSSVRLLDSDFDVFDDDSVRILRAPGHTPGSQMLLVRLRKTGPVLLSGDLYLYESQRIHCHVSPFHTSVEQTVASRQRVENLLEDNPSWALWITHDAPQMNSLHKAPRAHE